MILISRNEIVLFSSTWKVNLMLKCWHSNIQETRCSIDLNNKKILYAYLL